MDHLLFTPCVSSVLRWFYEIYEDLNFVDDKLTAKKAKFMSLENLYVYGISFMQFILSKVISNIYNMLV